MVILKLLVYRRPGYWPIHSVHAIFHWSNRHTIKQLVQSDKSRSRFFDLIINIYAYEEIMTCDPQRVHMFAS